MRELRYGKNYRYAHSESEGYESEDGLPPPVRLEEYLPANLRDREYFVPGTQGDEVKLGPWITARRGMLGESDAGTGRLDE